MKIKTIALLLITLLVGCGEPESEIAEKIKLRVSSGGIVLPNRLVGTDSETAPPTTCAPQDITPPRVRLKASITWEGDPVEFGVLVPYILQFNIDDARLGKYSGAIASSQDDQESISYYFGATTDFIPNSGAVFTSSTCFADFGNLPAPNPPLTGRRQLNVKVKVLLAGVTRTTTANTEIGRAHV